MDKLLQYKKYLEFVGKATRSEYWAVYLLTWVFVIIATLLFFLLSLSGPIGILLGAVVMLATGFLLAWLMVATAVRRCRDAGINPWFVLSFIIPYVNFIVFIVFGCLASEKITEEK
jgi:uncharacterized membrane protein YhaH (DUF805 family)